MIPMPFGLFQYLWSVDEISAGVSFFLSIDRHTYHIYAATKGTSTDT